MARITKRESRAKARRETAATKLMVLGGAFVFVPLFLGNSLVGRALTGLRWPGLLLLLAGGILLWMQKKREVTLLARSANVFGVKSETARQEPVFSNNVVPMSRPKVDAMREREPKPTSWSVEVFNAVEWRRFEATVETLFQQAGFETKSKSHGADEGVDVWLYSRHHADGPVSLVQCKHWHGKQVGVDKIRELRGVMASFKVARGQYATTSTYSDAAKAFARENNINLLDVGALLALIAKRTPEQQAALLDVALEGDYWRPTCVNCGVKMVERNARNGGKAFWGCVNYPSCKTMMQVRGA